MSRVEKGLRGVPGGESRGFLFKLSYRDFSRKIFGVYYPIKITNLFVLIKRISVFFFAYFSDLIDLFRSKLICNF